MRVAAAVIAKKWLAERFGVRVQGYLAQIGEIVPHGFDLDRRSRTTRSSGPTRAR